MLVATAEANNLTAAAAAKDMYVHKMEDLCGGNQPYIKSNNLDTAHKLIRDGAIQQVREHHLRVILRSGLTRVSAFSVRENPQNGRRRVLTEILG
jgi:hypothetical protein